MAARKICALVLATCLSLGHGVNAAKSTPAECTAYQTAQQTNTDSAYFKFTVCSAQAFTDFSKCDDSACQGHFADAMQHAKDNHRADCQGVRQTLLMWDLTCAKKKDGTSCGGLTALNDPLTTISSAFSSMMTGASQTDEELDSMCDDVCADKMMDILPRMYAGSSDVSVNAFKSIKGLKNFVCKKLKGEYCYNSAGLALQTISGFDMSDTSLTKKLDEKICGSSRCGKVGLTGFAELLALMSGDNMDQSQQMMVVMYKAFAEFICLKEDTTDKYCIASFAEHPEGPDEGPCAEGYDANAAKCKTHLESFESMGCCFTSVLDMMSATGAVQKTKIEKLFQKGSLTVPSACQMDKYKAKIEFDMKGVSKTGAEAASATLKKDIAASVGVGESQVALTFVGSRRSMRRLKSHSGGDSTHVEAEVGVPTADEATSISSVAKEGIELPSTELELAEDGVELETTKVTASEDSSAGGSVQADDDEASAAIKEGLSLACTVGLAAILFTGIF